MKIKSKIASLLMAVSVAIGSVPTVPSVYAAETAPTNIADYALENNMLRYDSSLSDSSDPYHLQGLCVDDELKYMYLSADQIVKVDMETGKVVGTLDGFSTVSGIAAMNGMHLGSLEYHDGWIYTAVIAGNPYGKLMIIAIEASAIDRVGMQVNDIEGSVRAVLMKDHMDDYCDPVDETIFTGWKGPGYFTMSDREGHRFGCGGADGITIGTYPGDKSGKQYVIASYGIYANDANSIRQDNEYTILKFYALDDIWNSDKTPTSHNIVFHKDDNTVADYGVNEALTAEKTLFLYTGNIDWGPQNIAYEPDTGDIVLYCYGPTDFADDFDNVPRIMFVVDGSKAPEEKVLELGQNNTLANEADKATVKKIADAYSTDTNGNGIIDDTERLRGPVGTLKCICGDPDKHTAEVVGDATWGDTGVKKSEYPICGTIIFNNWDARADEGIAYIGKGSDGADYFYTRGGITQTEVNLWKRTIDSNTGEYKYEYAAPYGEAKEILHYSMDASDIVTENGIKYMKNTLDDKYHAIVEGTTAGIGVDGNETGAMNFNAYNYPASVDQMSLSDETIGYIDTRINNSEYSYSFWAKMATDNNTDGNFVPFIGFYRNDGTYAGVFEQRWRGEVKYVVNGIGSATAGDPGDDGVSIGKRDNGWHFYTVTEKAGVGTVYCDGNQKGSYNVSGDHLYRKHISEFIIGGGMSKIWYDKNNRGRLIGSVDDLTIYSGALTADEVKQAYNKTVKTDNTTVTSASADVGAAAADKLRANYDITADAGKDLTIDTGIAVTSVEGLTKDTDFTVSGNSITLKNSWLSNRQCGINTLVLNGGTNLELTITNVNTPVLNYSFGNVTGNTVKDSSVYGKDAVTTVGEFTTDHTGKSDGALMFNGYNYSKPEYVKLSDESAAWLNSVIKNGYTMNFWAYGTAENGSVMSMAGLYAADGRPLGVVESYEPSDNSSDNSLDKKITVHLDTAKLGGNKTNAANSIEAVSPEKIGLGGWNMYTASYDKATGKIKLYVDGQLKAENSVNDDIIGNISQLFAGHQYKKYYNASGYYDWLTRGGFKGAIDGISVYNSALSDDSIAALYNGEELDYGLAFFEDDFEGYNGSLDGTYTLGGVTSGGKMELGTEGDNHVLNVTKYNNVDNVQVSASFDKTYTEGAVYLKYSVKPYSGSSVMFWLVSSAGKQIRLPLFTNDGNVKVTGEGVTEAALGTFTAGEWYDVSAKVDLEAKLIDITVKNRNSGTTLSKTGIATSISDISSMRIQTWSADGTSSFDNIVLKSGRSEAVNDSDDNDYIINDNFENGLSNDYTQVGPAASTLDIGTDGTNKFLNIVNNDNNVQAKRAFDKEYTSGTIYVDYKVKPAGGASTMFWLNDKMRVPFFGSDGAIKILEADNTQPKAERKIGTWESGYWYEVSMKIDLDAGKYDVSIKKSGEASYAAQLIGDYTNITAIGFINMQMYGQGSGAFSSFDDLVVRHENTSSNEKLLFKDTFEYYNNNTLDTGSGKDYVIAYSGAVSFGIGEENGNHSGFISRNEGGDNIQMKKYFNNAYSSGIISLNYSVKPAAGVCTMLRMVNKDNNKAVLLPYFHNDGTVRIAGNGDIDIGTYTGGKWYDISSKINLNTKTADIVITERDTGSVIKYSNYPIGNDNVYELRMQVYGGNGPSYYDDIVVTHKAEEANLPYSNGFEGGSLDSMYESGTNSECKIVDSNDGHGKVYQLHGDGGAPKLEYNLGGITTGKIKIEADIKTGENTLATLLQLNDNALPNLIQFGNKDTHDGIWFGWDSAKYADTRLANAWYHVNVTLNLDTGLMDSFITDPNGKVYSLTKYKYADPNTKLDTVCFRTWDTGTCYVDNINLTIPESVGFEITARAINANGSVITDFATLQNASNPILNVNYYNASNRDKLVWVYVNTYKDNRLVKCKRELIVIGATEKEGTKSVDISDVSFEGADSMNVLIWDDIMCPMFNVLSIR